MPQLASHGGLAGWPLRLGILLLAVGMFGCDHATKIAAEAKLANADAMPLVKGVVELRYTRNDDTAFSVLHLLGLPKSPAYLLAAASIALLAIVIMWISSRRRASKAQHVAFALVASGALGNLVDRAIRGYVVDFIHVTRWPVFNVADIAVVAGVVLLVLASGLKSRKDPDPAQAREGPS